MKFKVGDQVTLSEKGVEDFSPNNWGKYYVPLSMFNGEWGTVDEIKTDDNGDFEIYVGNSVGRVYYGEDQLTLINLAQNELKEDTYCLDHYNLYYTLTEKDIEAGKIKVDAYWVAKQWKTGSRDDSGALWHSLKTIARFGEKNDKAREIKALYNQAIALARIYDVEL